MALGLADPLTETTEDTDQDGDPWWGSGLAASAYAAAGLVAVAVSRHIPNPWRTIVAIVGVGLALIGAWILLWFFAFLTMSLLDHREDWSPWVLPIIGVMIVVAAAWVVFLVR